MARAERMLHYVLASSSNDALAPKLHLSHDYNLVVCRFNRHAHALGAVRTRMHIAQGRTA